MKKILLLLLLVSCHCHTNKVESCGYVSLIQSNYYEININYVDKTTIPKTLILRFETSRPDTIIYGEKICFVKH